MKTSSTGKKLDRAYRHKTLHIIVDNLAIHKNQKVKEWLQGKRKVKLHLTPTYSSWLNQVEVWFNQKNSSKLCFGVKQESLKTLGFHKMIKLKAVEYLEVLLRGLFIILSKDVLKGGVWKSTQQLSAQMLQYIDTYNKTRAKPFAWTYTGDALKIS